MDGNRNNSKRFTENRTKIVPIEISDGHVLRYRLTILLDSGKNGKRKSRF